MLLGKNVKTRSCTLIDQVMIDLSPDIFSQCINSHVDLSEVNHLVFTHSHSDHLNTTEIYTHIDNEALRVAAKANPLSHVKMKKNED